MTLSDNRVIISTNMQNEMWGWGQWRRFAPVATTGAWSVTIISSRLGNLMILIDIQGEMCGSAPVSRTHTQRALTFQQAPARLGSLDEDGIVGPVPGC
jgi:hypothetical protein